MTVSSTTKTNVGMERYRLVQDFKIPKSNIFNQESHEREYKIFDEDSEKNINKCEFGLNDFSKIVKYWKKISIQRPSFFKKVVPLYDYRKNITYF